MSNNLISEVMAVPLGNIISSIGKGVGEAQAALDAESLRQTLMMYSKNGNSNELIKLFKEIGYRPTFYVIPETEVTTMISLTISGNDDLMNLLNLDNPSSQTPVKRTLDRITSKKSRLQPYATPINAGNANKYNVDIQAATTLKFKIVPVPTPVYVENVLANDEVDEFLDKVDNETSPKPPVSDIEEDPEKDTGDPENIEIEFVEEKTQFDVILKAAGPNKLQIIKLVKELTGLGLKEAKELVDTLPKPVKEAVTKEKAEDMKKVLEEAGAEVEIE